MNPAKFSIYVIHTSKTQASKPCIVIKVRSIHINTSLRLILGPLEFFWRPRVQPRSRVLYVEKAVNEVTSCFDAAVVSNYLGDFFNNERLVSLI